MLLFVGATGHSDWIYLNQLRYRKLGPHIVDRDVQGFPDVPQKEYKAIPRDVVETRDNQQK